MNIDVEKLRTELKNKIDEIIDSYITDDNTVLTIPNEKICMEFKLNNKNYIVFTEDEVDVEKMNVMFAKVELIEGKKVLRNIESSQEYENVVNEFNRRLELVSE